MRADVLDVSHYQNITDGFAGAKKLGVLGIIAKATESLHVTDATFRAKRLAAQQAGLLFGAYHFIRPGDPKNQADHFLDVVGDTTGVALVLDWEDPNVPISAAQEFAVRVFEKTGRYPVLYSYSAMLMAADRVMSQERKAFWSKTKLWIAAYSNTLAWPKDIWPQWWLWQFTGDGRGPGPHDVDGVGVHVDINVYSGERNALAADWSGQRPPVEPLVKPVSKARLAPAPGPAPAPEPSASLVERLVQLFNHFYTQS